MQNEELIKRIEALEKIQIGVSMSNDEDVNILRAVERAWAGKSIHAGISTNSLIGAQLSLNSKSKGFLPPRLTTTQRDAIVNITAGLIVYNTTTNKLNVYTTAWEAITSA